MAKSKRIAILSSEFPPGPGGIGTHAYQIACHLQRDGWQVSVLASQDYADESEISRFNSQQPFQVKWLRPRSHSSTQLFSRLSIINRQIKSWQPDIIFVSGQRMTWLVAGLMFRYRLPWVAVGHGVEFGGGPAWVQTMTRWAYNRARAVVCVSQYTQQRMNQMGICPTRQTVIVNGADDTVFHPLPAAANQQWRDQHGFTQARLLLTVGNTTERKGQDVVIRALPDILKICPDVHYLMAGLPTGQARLTALAQELGVTDHVHFLGRVDLTHLAQLYNVCDVYIMTSRHTADGDFEGYGIAVVEAALCGKPAVVSQGAGLAEAIKSGETGLLVGENNPAETALAVIDLMQDDTKRDGMGKQARQRALQQQTWAGQVKAYETLFLEVMSK